MAGVSTLTKAASFALDDVRALSDGELKSRLRAHILEHSILLGDFVLKSGKQSNWFIDAKKTVCSPEGMLMVAESIHRILPAEASAIGGLTMGADPVAFSTAAICASLGRPLRSFSVRKEAKDHGGGGKIAGYLNVSDKVVITEDAVTRGTSMLDAINAVRQFGAEVVLAVAMVDRGGSVTRLLEHEKVPFRALLSAPELGFDYEGGLEL